MTSVALVDDHELLRTGLAAIIGTFEGFKVVMEANNGREFIEQLKGKTPPDIVLLDITMPVMDGYETAIWIRANLPQIKVLVLSMLENDTAIIRMLKNGARGYILKDSKPKVFKDALDNVRDSGYFINELVSNKLMHYINHEEVFEGDAFILNNLSENETVFLKWICTEKTYKEIADEMCLSPRTIDTYRDNLFKKLDVKTRVGLAIFAIKNSIVNI
ncbi:MAG: response regulator transcription factor [Chitinophagaceae bacterium]|nr:response regulator transcription factor [Chitinophagaceae bacterium]MDP1764073.1 response regulator transcription factor [Sediminibacterium sp.]MDP1811035.1 response regulator transcription factor [Sediminibacterium sp.]MDP3128231.1 response regulator transcription factor [Sediminibacterium sp.]MDP3666608.1 response regulator transcription factor [Sediminibacterium sp.]